MSRNFQNGVGLVIAGALFIALSAQFTFPLPATDIPQTAQTIALLVTGYSLGVLRGVLAVLVYLFLGLAGLPVYSDGASGWTTLTSSSFGYFVGFLGAGAMMGYVSTQWRGFVLWSLTLMMFAGHLLILAFGWLWLMLDLGALDAYRTGVSPFYYGAIVKSLLCSSIVLALRRVPVPGIRPLENLNESE